MQAFVKIFILSIWTNTALAANLFDLFQYPQSNPEQIALEEAKAIQTGCKPAKRDIGFIPVLALIQGSGKFCLVQDLVQRRLRSLDDGSIAGSPSDNGHGIVIFYDIKDVQLDLQGHLVSAIPFENTEGVIPSESPSLRTISLKNGRIETPGPRSYGVILTRYVKWGWVITSEPGERPYIYKRVVNEDTPLTQRMWNEAKRTYYEIPWNYEEPDTYVLENLHITSGGRGVVMSGVNNVLRNSTVEVDSKTAVYMYGPGTVIEGNTFIVKLDPQDDAPLPAILKLRDAHGAIIRNNKFLVKQEGVSGLFKAKGQSEAAINLLESKNVLIENNDIQDNKVMVRKDKVSTTIERGNVMR